MASAGHLPARPGQRRSAPADGCDQWLCDRRCRAGGAGAEFVYTTDPTKYADKSCVLKNAAGTTLALTDKILPTETYTFVAFIKDNREFDYASAAGVVIDPIMAAVAEPKATKSSSSGCNAGFAALALLAIVPVVCRRKK